MYIHGGTIISLLSQLIKHFPLFFTSGKLQKSEMLSLHVYTCPIFRWHCFIAMCNCNSIIGKVEYISRVISKLDLDHAFTGKDHLMKLVLVRVFASILDIVPPDPQ